MIKLSHWIKITIAAVIAIALGVFVYVNTPLFMGRLKFETFEYTMLYILSAGVLILLSLDLRELPKKLYNGLAIFALCAIPFIMMQISMTLAGESEYRFGIYMMNILMYSLPIIVAYLFTANFSVSATIGIIIGGLLNAASYVLNILRGTPFIPTDLLAINTAVKVVGGYEFELEWQLVSAIVMLVFSLALVWAIPLKLKFKRSPLICRGAAGAVLLVIAIVFSNIKFSEISMDIFDQYHANNTHGTAYSFFINVCKMKLERPQGYNEDDTLNMVNNLKEETADEKPNVVVIMNESYSDLSVIGEFKTNRSYNSYFKSLKDNTVRGELLVSPFGGYTCNTEFEFLSGLSMGLLPSGGTPYLQYINKQCPYFLPAYMKGLGYKTIALHPYYARCWNRTSVYEHLYFDEFISLETMGDYQNKEDFELMRSFYSDNTSYSSLINQFEIKEPNEKLFLFNITMQNHGGYTHGGFTSDVQITDMDGDYPQAEQYLSLIRQSDKALEILIDYFRDYDEPTVIVMFGDHQPGIEQEFYEELYGRTLDEISSEEMQKRYTVPFIIWTNYEQESKNGIKTSVNYLSNLMLESAKLPKNKINLFLDTIENDIPQINAAGHYDVNGKWTDNNIENSDALKNYSYLEYLCLPTDLKRTNHRF